jgi:hypothetical protein
MAGSRTFDRPQSLSSQIRGALANWRDLLVLARELRGLDPERARRLLEARGLIGPDDASLGPRVRILYRLLRLLGINSGALGDSDPALLRDLESTCDGCTERRRCESDHENGYARATYHNDCPNAAKLDALRFATPDPSRA